VTAYRLRIKFDPDPTSLWRDIVVGESRTLDELQSAVNPAFGLDDDHLWFFGEGEDYWNSTVKYQRPEEHEDLPSGEGRLLNPEEETFNAGEKTVGDMIGRLELERGDRSCYLYDYGDEWRLYAILKERLDDEPDAAEPEVVGGKGDEIDQYGYSI